MRKLKILKMNIWGLQRLLKKKRNLIKKERNKPRGFCNFFKIKKLESSMQKINTRIKYLKESRKKHK